MPRFRASPHAAKPRALLLVIGCREQTSLINVFMSVDARRGSLCPRRGWEEISAAEAAGLLGTVSVAQRPNFFWSAI